MDFEKIGETFEDGFDKAKDFVKDNKVFTIALCGVGIFALYKLYTKKKAEEETEYVSTYAYVPTGYEGLPTMSESFNYDELVGHMRTETSDIIENMWSENDNRFDTMVESITAFDEKLSGLSYLETQRIIEQMKANSEAWWTASDSEKERLHQENLVLGTLLDADYDSYSGSWSKDGDSLYDVSIKNKTNTSTAGLTNVGVVESSVTRESVISQMKANSEAWWTASDSEKVNLETANRNLGALIGASYNSGTGVWSDSSGSPLYSVSSSSTKSTSKNSTNVKTSSSSSTKTSSSNKTSDVVSQMKANSEAWHTASDSEKKNLASKNQELGKSIGASYDSATGTWSKDGTKLY